MLQTLHLLALCVSLSLAVKYADFPFYYDPSEIDYEEEGIVGTPKPFYRTVPPDFDFRQFTMPKKNMQEDIFSLLPTEKLADQLMKKKLLKMLQESMKEIEWKIKFLRPFYIKIKNILGGGTRVSDIVNKAYRNLATLFKRVKKHHKRLHPLNILRAYDQLLKGDKMLAYILDLAKNGDAIQSGDDSISNPGSYSSIAWSYYDYTLS